MSRMELMLYSVPCYLNTHLLLEVKELLFGESCDLSVLLVKVASKGRIIYLQFGK